MGAGSNDEHEWISFDDPDGTRTWNFDVTFLLSAWTCIFGSGCQGVLDRDATSMQQGCCSYGAHFVDDADVATVVAAAGRLKGRHWQFKKQGMRDGFLGTDPDDPATTVTRLRDGACIFLNRPGFAGGAGCALHVAALDVGERPMDWKPDVCWQLPLRLHEDTDSNGRVTATLREWKRRDWGEGGANFHWWCTETHEAFVASQAVYRTLRDEIIEFIGEQIYELLVDALERRISRPVPLPHPAVRRRG